MKTRLLIICMIALGVSCKEEITQVPNPVAEHIQADNPGEGEDEEEMHLDELIIYCKNSSNVPQALTFCMFNADNSELWECQSSVAVVTPYPAAWDMGEDLSPASGFEEDQYYYIIPDGSYPKQILRYKMSFGCSPSPDTYFNYNTTTKQFSLVSLGCGVTYNISTFYDSPL